MLKYTLYLTIMSLLLAVTACSSASSATTADAIAGVWTGEMRSSDGPDTAQVEAVIPEGYTPARCVGLSGAGCGLLRYASRWQTPSSAGNAGMDR